MSFRTLRQSIVSGARSQSSGLDAIPRRRDAATAMHDDVHPKHYTDLYDPATNSNSRSPKLRLLVFYGHRKKIQSGHPHACLFDANEGLMNGTPSARATIGYRSHRQPRVTVLALSVVH
uniref:Uncharacterized protein n=1 Tax=Mycena chlorophos TaxID=658473 RepID=A0ABQ0LVU5_MYCCL|nr:predicted protein [Mycena chlorophos]